MRPLVMLAAAPLGGLIAASVSIATILPSARADPPPLGLGAIAPAHAQSWYFAKLGPDKCVSIQDVDPHTFRRLYYHAGPMRTLQDVDRAFAAMGAIKDSKEQIARDMPHAVYMVNHITVYSNPRDASQASVLLDGKALCDEFMSDAEQ
jgi:hypothetical protein